MPRLARLPVLLPALLTGLLAFAPGWVRAQDDADTPFPLIPDALDPEGARVSLIRRDTATHGPSLESLREDRLWSLLVSMGIGDEELERFWRASFDSPDADPDDPSLGLCIVRFTEGGPGRNDIRALADVAALLELRESSRSFRVLERPGEREAAVLSVREDAAPDGREWLEGRLARLGFETTSAQGSAYRACFAPRDSYRGALIRGVVLATEAATVEGALGDLSVERGSVTLAFRSYYAHEPHEGSVLVLEFDSNELRDEAMEELLRSLTRRREDGRSITVYPGREGRRLAVFEMDEGFPDDCRRGLLSRMTLTHRFVTQGFPPEHPVWERIATLDADAAPVDLDLGAVTYREGPEEFRTSLGGAQLLQHGADADAVERSWGLGWYLHESDADDRNLRNHLTMWILRFRDQEGADSGRAALRALMEEEGGRDFVILGSEDGTEVATVAWLPDTPVEVIDWLREELVGEGFTIELFVPDDEEDD